jgi:hypothetical protein
MATPLPSITYQRRKSFRPSDEDIIYAYNIINRYVFDNQLRRPEILQQSLRKAWGYCQWLNEEQNDGSSVQIRLMDKWFCPQWFMNTLAHEMVHQYQWDVYRYDHMDYYGRDINQSSGAHGPSFYFWRERFENYDLNLKMAFGQRRWFKYQDFNKC